MASSSHERMQLLPRQDQEEPSSTLPSAPVTPTRAMNSRQEVGASTRRSSKIWAFGGANLPTSPKTPLKVKRISSAKAKRSQEHCRSAYARPPIMPKKKSPVARKLFTPSADEMEEFFAASEDKTELSNFINRYNFDVVHDVPLPGRYEWVKVQE